MGPTAPVGLPLLYHDENPPRPDRCGKAMSSNVALVIFSLQPLCFHEGKMRGR